jgi:hypothetical protein
MPNDVVWRRDRAAEERARLPHWRVVDPILHVEEDAHRVEAMVDDEVDDPRCRACMEALGHHLEVFTAVPDTCRRERLTWRP